MNKMELNRISSFKSFSEMKKQQDAVKTEQDNKSKRVKSLEKISAILDELEISDMSELDEEKKRALVAKIFNEDRAEEIEKEIMAMGKEKDAVEDVLKKVEEDRAEEIEGKIKDLGEPEKEDADDAEEVQADLYEATVTLDAIEPNEKGLVDFCKKKGIKWKIVNMNGPAANYPEVEYVGKKKDLEKMIQDFWGKDSGLEEFIEEAYIFEARSINKIQNDWSKITAEMAAKAQEWKAAEGDAKAALLDELKAMTAKKKALEAELNDAVAGKDKDLELAVSEGNAFTGALFAARNKGQKTFEFNGKTYKVHGAKTVNEDDEEVQEGNAFGDAVRKAKEEGKDEFEFQGKTYKVEESKITEGVVSIKGGRIIAHKVLNKLVDMDLLSVRKKTEDLLETIAEVIANAKMESVEVNEGSHGMAKRLLNDIIKGNTSRAEGIKMSKELAEYYLDWIERSEFGKRNSGLPLFMIVKASFNWNTFTNNIPKELKDEVKDLQDYVKKNESLEVNEGAVKQFEMDYADMEKSIKRGIGWIDPDYVATTWENSSDSFPFELVASEIYGRLIKAGLLWYADEETGEDKGEQVKSLKELGIKESAEVNEAKAKGLDWIISQLGDNPECMDVASFVYDNYDKVTGLRKSMRNDEMDFPDEIMEVVDHYGLDIDEFTDCYGMAAESVVTEGKHWHVLSGNKWYTGSDFSTNPADAMKYDDIMSATKVSKKVGGMVHVMTDDEMDKAIKKFSKNESLISEEEIQTDDEFKEYAFNVLQKAFGEEFDAEKAQEVVDGILKKCGDDYGACVGTLTSSLGESVSNEGIDVKYWADYHDHIDRQGNSKYYEKSRDFDTIWKIAVKSWDEEAADEENKLPSNQEPKIKKLAKEFFDKAKWISVNVCHAMINQEMV